MCYHKGLEKYVKGRGADSHVGLSIGRVMTKNREMDMFSPRPLAPKPQTWQAMMPHRPRDTSAAATGRFKMKNDHQRRRRKTSTNQDPRGINVVGVCREGVGKRRDKEEQDEREGDEEEGLRKKKRGCGR
jgi:hypothetical protein